MYAFKMLKIGHFVFDGKLKPIEHTNIFPNEYNLRVA